MCNVTDQEIASAVPVVFDGRLRFTHDLGFWLDQPKPVTVSDRDVFDALSPHLPRRCGRTHRSQIVAPVARAVLIGKWLCPLLKESTAHAPAPVR
jgi:hypothetical protein